MELTFLLPLSVLILVWVVLGYLFARAWPHIRSMVRSLHPQMRFVFTLMYGMLPGGIAAAVALLVFTPLIGGMNLSGHCHALECAAHVPVLQAGPVSTAILSTLLLFGITILFFVPAAALWNNWRFTAMLTRLADRNPVAEFYLLDTSEPVACCTGLLSPAVVISRGLQQRVTPEQLNIIVSHELAHACRYDNLCKMLLSWATVSWPAATRRQLLADIELAGEQACDAQVAALCDRRQVAETIRTVAVLQSDADANYTDKTPVWQDRVAALMQSREQETMQGWKTAMAVMTGSAVLLLISSDVLHRAAETLLSVVPVY